jgi:fermentation-respiration switch protein FrsA (DUF1100 family)
MRALVVVVGILLVLYLLLIAAAWAWQERVVWQPPRLAGGSIVGAHRLEYQAEDGQALFAYVVGDPLHARGVLIAFHGNAELAMWAIPWAEEIVRRTGWAVLLPEYRGYGGLPGSPDYPGSRRDARATLHLARTKLGAAHVAYFGHSLGSAVATELAAEQPPASLLLQAPFTSARDMARALRLLPIASLWGIIARVQFDTRSKVSTMEVPVSVVHGDRDIVVPLSMGRAVHEAARVKGELLVVPGAGHNDIAVVGGAQYWAWLVHALKADGR